MIDSATKIIYRKSMDSEAWHWCTQCTEWPTDAHEEQIGLPITGHLCAECKAKELAGECDTLKAYWSS